MADDLERASDELLHVFMRMSGPLFSEETLNSSLDLMCSLAHETIAGTAGAGVTLVRDGRKFTAAYSDEVVREADRFQYEMDQGPCLMAWREGVVVRVDSTADEVRWPRWGRAAAGLGMMSSLSVPLDVRGEVLGAVKVYSRDKENYSDAHERILELFSQHAAIVLSNVLAYTDAQKLSDQLKEALGTRDVIGMAKGILIANETVDEEAAFTMLREASQRENVKLRDMAREVVRRTAQPGER